MARTLTAINPAIDLPLVLGSEKISAYNPPTTAVGEEAKIPENSLKITIAAKLGATAQARLKIVYPANVQIITGRLPYVSDNGPKKIGPRIYPIK